MTTFYLDLEGGNDANDGTTFANRWKTFTNGATAARIAPGDTIRVMGSPAPTSIGNATWTLETRRRIAMAVGSSTNTTPITVTINSHNFVNGDTVLIQSHTTNTNANGVWKLANVGTNTFDLINADGTNSVGNGVGGVSGNVIKLTGSTVILASALTRNIACYGNQGSSTRGAFTLSTDVTGSVPVGSTKESILYQQIVIGTAFTTGKAAYQTISTLDLSGYQQLSFYIQQTSGTYITSGELSICLCSDTAGNTPVNTFSVPAVLAGTWMPVTIDLGSAMGSAIQSIAIYVNTDAGGKTLNFNNFLACKSPGSADSLTLTSLISKNGTNDAWYPVQSINNTRVILDGTYATYPSNVCPAYTPTETVATYKRDTIKTTPVSSTSTTVNSCNEAGTVGSPITYSGGWNRTDMSTQTGETWIDGSNGMGTGIAMPSSGSYVNLDKLNLCRYYIGVGQTGTNSYISIGSIKLAGVVTPIYNMGYEWSIQDLNCVNSGTSLTLGPGTYVNTIHHLDGCISTSVTALSLGISCKVDTITSASFNGQSGASFGTDNVIGSATLYGNLDVGCYVGTRCRIGYLVVKNSNYAIYPGGNDAIISGGYTQGNFNYPVYTLNTRIRLRNFVINETNEVVPGEVYAQRSVYSHNHDNTAGNHRVYWSFGLIEYQTAIKHGASNGAWKLSPTSSVSCLPSFPMLLPLAVVACTAGTLVTIKTWVRRSNTGLTVNFVALGGHIGGVDSNVSSSMTAAADTWEELTLTFTPTETSAIPIELQCYGGSTYSAYVCDMTISQA